MMKISGFKAWLNEEWINGRLTHSQHSIISEHSIINKSIIKEKLLEKWTKSPKK